MNDQINQNTSYERYGLKPYKNRTKIRNIFLIILSFVILASLATGFSFYHKMKQFREGGPWLFMLNKATKDLNLTSDQQKQLQAIKDEIKTKMEGQKDNRKDAMSDFENAFKQDKLDVETLKSLEQKNESGREEMKEFFMGELVKFHDILTPDQRSQLIEKLQDMAKNHDTWKHKDKSKPQNQ